MTIDLTKHTFTSTKFASVIQEAINFFVKSPTHSLPPAEKFLGAGVYALYYQGGFEQYLHVAKNSEDNATIPIYIGKAVPPGWRVGRSNSLGKNAQPLFHRLQEHSKSIQQVVKIDTSDFICRFMILDGIESDLISACEAKMIRLFTPLWNTVVDGFGNHTPGEGRFDQAKSEWDVLHPGRAWAAKCRGVAPDINQIKAKIVRHRDE